MPSLNGIIKSFCYRERRHYHAPCPHFTMGRRFPTKTAPSRGMQVPIYGTELAKANRRALQIGISIQSSCSCTAHECDRQTRRTDIPVAVLNLRLLGWEASAFLVPNLVEFSSRDLKVLTVQPLWLLVTSGSNSAALGDWKNYLYCVARLKADLISPACYMPHSFSRPQWRWYSSTRSQTNLATGRIDLILWSHEPTTKILRGGRRKGKLGLPLGTGSGKASGAWTQNFSRQLQVSKHEQKVVIKMAASRPSWSEIGQVESSQKSSTSRWSRSTKQPSRLFRPTRSTTGSTHDHNSVNS